MTRRTPIPKNEAARLKALHEYQILDSLPELSYDDLTKLAATICGCPFSIITFVDQDRQWFKSILGLAAKQTPREGGFCAHAILEVDFFTVEDAAEDERFKDHLFVAGQPNIRFYAASPVKVGNDLNVGVICVIDDKPRKLNSVQIEALKALSRMVGVLLENRKQYAELKEAFTFRRDAEKLLVHSSKMTALGEMSAGVAHEINNPLAIISGTVELLSKFKDNPEKLASKIETIQKSCDRIAKIVSGLKKFSRSSGMANLLPHALCGIVLEASVLAESKSNLYNTPVTLEINTQALINCDEIEIEQVIINLIHNGIDAVRDQSEKWIKLSIFEEGGSVVLRVMDSGPGISKEVREKLFQPFFTTKKVGDGTGLGLSIAKGILDEHKATIAVITDVPNTCFEIRFPRSESEAMKNVS